jgi:hypothetical protein
MKTVDKALSGMKKYIWGAAITTCGAVIFTTGIVLVGVANERKVNLSLIYNQGPGLNLCYKF